MNDEKKFKRKVINIIVLTAAMLLAEVAAIFWLSSLASKKAAEIEEKRLLVSSLKREISSFDFLNKDYERAKPFIHPLENALPKEEGLARVLDDLESIGRKLGIRLSVRLESQSSLPAEVEGVRFVPFSASLASDLAYSRFRQFLGELHGSPLFTQVDSFSISSPASINAGNSGGNIIIQGRIYVR
ncbi:hypothetical protein HYV91_03595 [Candidatus Wolfebacteria bacterium]|nr:hypothetical protein [Candidatus Wolfebacteria bacterium]